MADQFSETSSQGWLGRIGGAIKGMFFGILLMPVAILLLFWNETRAVHTAKSLKEGSAEVISAAPDSVSPGNDGKLIHLSGDVTTTETLRDPMFGLNATALRFSRRGEMYQWSQEKTTETHDKLGGGKETVTKYTYKKAWSDKVVNSLDFKDAAEHTNPTELPVPPYTAIASKATLGAFKIPVPVIGKMQGDEPLPATEDCLAQLSPELKAKAKVYNDYLYLGNDPSNPAIGDERIGFKILKPATFSILAQQSGDSLAPFPTQAGPQIERVESGTVSADAMFQHAASENKTMTWILRAVGFAAMFIGFILILNPLDVFADVIPFVGGIMEFGTTLVAGLLAVTGSLVIIALAWLAARPLLGGTLLLIAIAALIHAVSKIHEHKRPAAGTA